MLSSLALLTALAALAAAAPTPQINVPVTTPRGNPAGIISLGPGTSTITTWPNNPQPWNRPWPNAPWDDDDDYWEPPRNWRSGPRSGPRKSPIIIQTTPGVSSSLDIQ
jgi:hypothetical protein